MPPAIFESKLVKEMSEPLRDSAKRMEVLFPSLEWDLRKAGYSLDISQYLAVVIYLTLITVILSSLVTVLPVILVQGFTASYASILFSLVIGGIAFMYLMFIPKSQISKRSRLIDRNLEYMLKDMQIQLSSGVPLFDTIVNIARGQYGECSKIADGIVQEVQSGRSMIEVLDDVGMWSPSEYLRKVMWQIVNAVKSGSDIIGALSIISHDIQLDKESKIKTYGQELNLWSLVFMLGAIIMPSMGITLLVILSSFVGAGFINETLFWLILFGLIAFQAVFISFVKNKRPEL